MTAPLGQEQVRWFLGEDGRVIGRTCRPGGVAQVRAPGGTRSIDAAEAAERLAAIDTANRQAARRQAERAALEAETDYQALIAAGFPGRLATKLTGHRPRAGVEV